MNKTKIEWTDFSWNPVTGCLRGCHFCYARGVARRFGKTPEAKSFQPEFHEDRLYQPAGRDKPAKIFVCSMADLFGHWVPDEWIYDVLDVVRNCPRHTFQLLTKYPARLRRFMFPPNAWVGTTVTDQRRMLAAEKAMADVKATVRFISAEPLLGRVVISKAWIPDWVIIGPMTGPSATPIPDNAAEGLTSWCDNWGVPVFHKPALGDGFDRREFPAARP